MQKIPTWVHWNVQTDRVAVLPYNSDASQSELLPWEHPSTIGASSKSPNSLTSTYILLLCFTSAELKANNAHVIYTRSQGIHARILQQLKILHEHLHCPQTASLKGEELGNSTSSTIEKESLQNSSGMQKNLVTLPNICSTLLVITNLHGVYILSIIFITRDQKEITSGGCKLFTQGPCLSKQREQLFYFNHLYGDRNVAVWHIAKLICCPTPVI